MRSDHEMAKDVVEIRATVGYFVVIASMAIGAMLAVPLLIGWDQVGSWFYVGLLSIFVVLFGGWAYSIAKMVVIADAGGLVVRNGQGRWKFDWSEVEDFRLSGDTKIPGVYVVLKANDAMLPLDATRYRMPVSRDSTQLQGYVAELRGCLQRYTNQ